MKQRPGILFLIMGVMLSVGQSFVFEEKTLKEALEKYKPKFPEPLPNNAQITFSYAGPFFGLLEKDEDLKNVKLTLDVNMNHDLTDDAAFDLPVCEDWKEGTRRAYRVAALQNRLFSRQRA